MVHVSVKKKYLLTEGSDFPLKHRDLKDIHIYSIHKVTFKFVADDILKIQCILFLFFRELKTDNKDCHLLLLCLAL